MTKKLEILRSVEELAKESRYRVAHFARKLGCSRRWIQEVFCQEFGESPHILFARWRAQEIERAVKGGKRGKQILGDFGLLHTSSLTRALKRDAGHGLRKPTLPKKLKKML